MQSCPGLLPVHTGSLCTHMQAWLAVAGAATEAHFQVQFATLV